MLTPLRVARADEAPAVAALVNAAFQVEAFFKRGDRTDVGEVGNLMQRGEFLVLDESPPPDASGTRLAACVYTRTNGDRGAGVIRGGFSAVSSRSLRRRLAWSGGRGMAVHTVVRLEIEAFHLLLRSHPGHSVTLRGTDDSTPPL